jgi:hypothetical protein
MRKHDERFTDGVTQDIAMDCVDAAGQSMQLDAALGYQPDDPYAVTVTFRTPGGDVVWTFARDLLSCGLTVPTGEGDVHVWPCLSSEGRAVIIIELRSPDGELLVQAPAPEIIAFVDRTVALVPVGTESSRFDIDELIGQLFTV